MIYFLALLGGAALIALRPRGTTAAPTTAPTIVADATDGGVPGSAPTGAPSTVATSPTPVIPVLLGGDGIEPYNPPPGQNYADPSPTAAAYVGRLDLGDNRAAEAAYSNGRFNALVRPEPPYHVPHFVPGDLNSPLMQAMKRDPDNRALGNGQSWNELVAWLDDKNAKIDADNADMDARYAHDVTVYNEALTWRLANGWTG